MKSSLPLIEPVRPVLTSEVPRGASWRYELKLDGFRGVLYVDGSLAAFRSKRQRAMPRFARLAKSVAAELPARSAILDGEIVAVCDGGLRFDALMRGGGVPQFAAFDLLWLDGRDLRAQSYRERKAALRKLVRRARWVAFVDGHTDAALFDAAARMDLEGVVAKRADDVYGPETCWLKVRNPRYSQLEGRWG